MLEYKYYIRVIRSWEKVAVRKLSVDEIIQKIGS